MRYAVAGALGSLCLGLNPVSAFSGADMRVGLEAFRHRHWKAAGEQFLAVLAEDPKHREAQTYLTLTVQELQSQQRQQQQVERQRLLEEVALRLDRQQKNSQSFWDALKATQNAEAEAHEAKWDAACNEVEVDLGLGRVLPAYARVFHVLEMNPRHVRAGQLLSLLQSRGQFLLEKGHHLSSAERFALEGFQFFALGDFLRAEAAWTKADAVAERGGNELYFKEHWKTAEKHAHALRERVALQSLFRQGEHAFEQQQFSKSLQLFRRIAVLDPEFPRLGLSLARAEAAVEKDRARRLGEKKQREVRQLFDSAVEAMQQERYIQAQHILKRVLALDASHSLARNYLVMVDAEVGRRYDPKLAQQHYEMGLIAYASGRLEEAVREWDITVRMDARHARAQQALSKVRKALSLTDAIIP